MAYLNIFQRLACEGFPNADLLPFAVADGVTVEAAVNAGETGNRLFDFVYYELADLSDEDRDEAVNRLRKAAETLNALTRHVGVSTWDGLIGAKGRWLTDHGYFVGNRDPRVNTKHPGTFMVTEADFAEHDLPTEDGSHMFAIVGDDLNEIIAEAFDALAA